MASFLMFSQNGMLDITRDHGTTWNDVYLPRRVKHGLLQTFSGRTKAGPGLASVGLKAANHDSTQNRMTRTGIWQTEQKERLPELSNLRQETQSD